MEEQASFNGWARVEIMGHVVHVGFVTTQAFGQAVLFRIDTPELPEREWTLTRPEYDERGRLIPAGTKVKRELRAGASVLVGAGRFTGLSHVPKTRQNARLKPRLRENCRLLNSLLTKRWLRAWLSRTKTISTLKTTTTMPSRMITFRSGSSPTVSNWPDASIPQTS